MIQNGHPAIYTSLTDATLAKNRAQLFTLFALSNLFLMRRRLMA